MDCLDEFIMLTPKQDKTLQTHKIFLMTVLNPSSHASDYNSLLSESILPIKMFSVRINKYYVGAVARVQCEWGGILIVVSPQFMNLLFDLIPSFNKIPLDRP